MKTMCCMLCCMNCHNKIRMSHTCLLYIHTRQGSDVGFLMYHDPCNMKKNARYAVAFCAVFMPRRIYG